MCWNTRRRRGQSRRLRPRLARCLPGATHAHQQRLQVGRICPQCQSHAGQLSRLAGNVDGRSADASLAVQQHRRRPAHIRRSGISGRLLKGGRGRLGIQRRVQQAIGQAECNGQPAAGKKPTGGPTCAAASGKSISSRLLRHMLFVKARISASEVSDRCSSGGEGDDGRMPAAVCSEACKQAVGRAEGEAQ